MSSICKLFGFSRQAFYQHFRQEEVDNAIEMLIINKVKEIRKDHKVMGTRKLYYKLTSFMQDHQIKMGRDALLNCLSKHYLLVRKRKRKVSTTMSHHHYHKYKNQIKGLNITRPNELYVSDITYWKVNDVFLYISLITDVFSHKIVGYHVAQTLEALESKKALEMALEPLSATERESLMHHSDRGIQYCSAVYVKLLQDNEIKISMTETSEPTDNAIAERINSILKEEYLRFYGIKDIMDAKLYLKKAVDLYNSDRPHMSINNLTPEYVHKTGIVVEKLWKIYPYKKVSEFTFVGFIRHPTECV